MSSSSFSRGNGRVSGVDKDQIEDAGRESPITLRSRLPAQITNCGDDSAPCQDIVLELYGIMGQEDQFRQKGGERVQRGGIARVVLTTSVRADVTIEYVRNPSNEDNPNFTDAIEDISEEERHHEFFFGVDPSTLYAFRIDAHSSDCPDTDERSGIYYFKTGGTIQVEFFSFLSEVKTSTIPLGVVKTVDVNPMNAQFKGLAPNYTEKLMGSGVQGAVTLAAPTEQTTTTLSSSTSTSYTITQN